MIKKRFSLIPLILAVLFIFSGCTVTPPTPPPDKFKLPYNYEMWMINSGSIVIGIRDSEATLTYINKKGETIGLEPYVDEISYNERFVGGKMVDITFDSRTNNSIIKSNPRYYLIDTKGQKLYGPFKTIEQFDKKCSQLKIYNLSKWQITCKMNFTN